MPCAATQMDLEIVILSKVSQTEKEKYSDIPYMWNLKKKNDTNELTCKTERDSQTQRMNLLLLEGRMGGRDSQGVWDGHVHKVIFKMDNKHVSIIQHIDPCSMLYGSLDGSGVWGRMDTCICMAESLH